MSKIEKTVFISYRRTNSYHARAIFQDLRGNGYDVFMDYESINSGSFSQIILNQIKARAHFVVILTPSALERCSDPNDWLRREIETAIDEKRNIIPVMMDGFSWRDVGKYLLGKISTLNEYSFLSVPSQYFEEAMNRLRTRFLNVPIEVVIHPTPKEDEGIIAQKIQTLTNQIGVTKNQLSASEYSERAYQYHLMGHYDESIADCTEAIRLNPQDASAYNNRGLSYHYGKADYNRAIADYTEAIRLNPQDASAYNNRGFSYNSKKDYKRAIADCTEAIRLNPQFPIAYGIRGLAYNNKGDYDRAIADFNEGIRLDPQRASAYVLRGIAYVNKNDYDRAIADYNRALEIDPNHSLARQNREKAIREKRGR